MNVYGAFSKFLASATFFAGVLVLSSTVSAASGWVSGRALMRNINSGYCPTGANCTGSQYPQSQFNVDLPVPNAEVRVLDTQNPVNIIGIGSTDTAGNYKIKWTGHTSNPSPANLKVQWLAKQKDGVFWVTNTSGALRTTVTNAITTQTGTTSASPQNIGDSFMGTKDYWNVFWATERQWRTTIVIAGGNIGNAAGVEMRGFANDQPNFLQKCDTSCAQGETRRVQLDSQAAYRSQARAMHEFGHIASYWARPWRRAGDYSWNDPPGTDPTWGQTSYEWGVSAFEEAFATHYGNITFWFTNSENPTTCNVSQGHCFSAGASPVPLVGNDLELTSYPFATNNCVTTPSAPESRQPLSHMRFLWDVWDSHNDGTGDSYTANIPGHYAGHINLPQFYPAGQLANQHEEPWADNTCSGNPVVCNYATVAEKDGRGSTSYRSNYWATTGQNVGLLHLNNCSPQ